MATSGANLGCCGPFVRGRTGSDAYGGCFGECCRTCPPDCCDELFAYYECGTAQSPDFPDGCDCVYDSSGFMASSSVPLPSFNLDSNIIQPEEANGFVFALAGGCSVPCATIVVTATPTNNTCCLEGGGSDGFYLIGGPGGAIISASPSATDGCGSFEITATGPSGTVTGVNSITITGDDGDYISTSIAPLNDPDNCCPCCFTKRQDPCAPYTTPLFVRRKIKDKNRIFYNRKEMIKRLNKMHKAKVKKRSRIRGTSS